MVSQDVDDIVIRVGALLDDPSNSQFDRDYLMPYIDQEFGELDNELEALGAQYAEKIAVFDVPANTKDLSSFSVSGQALAFMKLPTRVLWKLKGQPDTQYQESTGPLEVLPNVPPQSVGAGYWAFTGGLFSITPSNQALTLEVYFEVLSTNIVDPQGNVILGTASLLAVRVAYYVAVLRGMALVPILEKKEMKAARDFKTKLTKNKQGIPYLAKKSHGRVVNASPVGYV